MLRDDAGRSKEESDEILAPLNETAALPQHELMTFEQLVHAVYLPFCRRKWKSSTTGTTEQRIGTHLLPAFAYRECKRISREELHDFLNGKANAGLSFSVVDHLRWDLRAIFEMATNEGMISRNPAKVVVHTTRGRPRRAEGHE